MDCLRGEVLNRAMFWEGKFFLVEVYAMWLEIGKLYWFFKDFSEYVFVKRPMHVFL